MYPVATQLICSITSIVTIGYIILLRGNLGLELFADRTSTHRMKSNQLRLWFSSVAYNLLHTLRCVALKGTQWAKAQCQTIRLKLLKIGGQIRVSVRRVSLSLSEGYPYQTLYAQALAQLQQLG